MKTYLTRLAYQFRLFTWAAMHSPSFRDSCGVELPVMLDVWVNRSRHRVYIHAELVLSPLEFSCPWYVEANYHRWVEEQQLQTMSNERKTLRDYGLKSIYIPILQVNILRRSHFMLICSRLEWDGFGHLYHVLNTHYQARIFAALDLMVLWKK